jgi:HlyD family secretion protein
VLYLLKDGKPTPVQVQFGISDGRNVQVTSGIKAGDEIVTGGGPATPNSGAAANRPGGGGGGGFGGGGAIFVGKPGG